MSESKVINIVSGKGGTGKSLLTAVLGRALARERQRVLIVDFDVFVRGLTVLLTESGKRPITASGSTISDLWAKGGMENIGHPEHLAIERFMDCDILPAVSDISAPFDFAVEDQLSERIDRKKLRRFLDILKNHYDIVLLDNRAGLDRFIVNSCEESDIVLAVAEDDDVSLQTNANLINHLRFFQKIRGVYTIINKARRVHNYEDIRQSKFRKVEFNYVGLIPFDSEVMDDFGKERFWSTVFETLYFRALIDAWNNLAPRENLPELSLEKYRFPPRLFMSPRSGRFPLVDRMLLIYGSFFSLFSPIYGVYVEVNRRSFTGQNVFLMVILSLVGLSAMTLGLVGFRRFLVGPSFSQDHKDRTD